MRLPFFSLPSLLFALFLSVTAVGVSASPTSDEVSGPRDPQAQYDLGMRYGRGEGVPRDYQLARQWLARAAAAGHLRARFALGWLYYTGSGVPQDFAKAAELFGYSAERGDAEAQYMMGVLYIEGRGVERDSKRSIVWMRKAAAQGHPGALGVIRGLFGPGVRP